MFMNPTSRVLSLLTALLIALVVGILGILYQLSFLQGLLVMAAVTLVAYILIYYSLEHFIYRKIKLIYKSIHQFRTQQSEFSTVPTFGSSHNDKIGRASCRERVCKYV